jgi:hypothetical protein
LMRQFGGVDRHKRAWADRGLIIRPNQGQRLVHSSRHCAVRVLRIPEEFVATEVESGDVNGYAENQW